MLSRQSNIRFHYEFSVEFLLLIIYKYMQVHVTNRQQMSQLFYPVKISHRKTLHIQHSKQLVVEQLHGTVSIFVQQLVDVIRK